MILLDVGRGTFAEVPDTICEEVVNVQQVELNP